MNLLNLLLDSQNSSAIKQLAANFGLSEDAAKSAVSEMAPGDCSIMHPLRRAWMRSWGHCRREIINAM